MAYDDSTETEIQDNNDYKYFCDKKGEELAQAICGKVGEYEKFLQESGLLRVLRTSARYYYNKGGPNSDDYANSTAAFSFRTGVLTGRKFKKVSVNKYGPNIDRMMQLITSQKPSYTVNPISNAPNSLQKSKKVEKVLEYYVRKDNLYDLFKECQRRAYIGFEGWISLIWDERKGGEYMAGEEDEETGETAIINKGDVSFRLHNLSDVIRDPYVNSSRETDWVILRCEHKKADLIDRFPKFKDEIGMASFTKSETEVYTENTGTQYKSNDYCEVFELYHKRTASMPNGRKAWVLATGQTLLQEGQLDTEFLPVVKSGVADIIGTPFSYSSTINMSSLQSYYNHINNIIVTNQTTFGTQSVLVPKGVTISPKSIATGLNALEYSKTTSPDNIKGVNFTNTANEILDNRTWISNEIQDISGIDSLKGSDIAPNASGVSIGLRHSLELKNRAMEAQTYHQLQEEVAERLLDVLKTFAKTPRDTGDIESQDEGVVEYTAEDLSEVKDIEIERVSPEVNSIGFKIDRAKEWLEAGRITKAQYFEVLETGKDDSILDEVDKEVDLIKLENDQLAEGTTPIINGFDNHVQHIREHKRLLQDPTIRKDAAAVDAIQDHMAEHNALYLQMDINTKEILGIHITAGAKEAAMQAPGGPAGAAPGAPSDAGPALDAQVPLPQGETPLPTSAVDEAASSNPADLAAQDNPITESNQ